MKRFFIITVSLWLLIAIGLLIGCGSSDKPSLTETESKTESVPLLQITKDYQIVRVDEESDLKDAAISLKNALLPILGEALPVVTDALNRRTNEYFNPEKDYEIIVGETNREETKAYNEGLAVNEYRIVVTGTKIVICGPCATQGVLYFIETYLGEGSTGELPSNLDITKTVQLMYTYQLKNGTAADYDSAVTATGLQGLFNRDNADLIYMTSTQSKDPSKYLTLFSSESRWMSAYKFHTVNSLKELIEIVSPKLKAVVIWDIHVPATVNVAATIAGVEDAVILTMDQYSSLKSSLPSDLKLISLEGVFDGSVTGSAKNDAYRWAIDEYLISGKVSTSRICYSEDSAFLRSSGSLINVCALDLAVRDRAFVFDLSCVEDEVPKDDLKQKVGLDRETYLLMLKTLQTIRGDDALTEITGFFSSKKYSSSGNDETFTSQYNGTQIEWKYTYTFTPYGCYWNSVTNHAYNQTVHSTQTIKAPLSQQEPDSTIQLVDKNTEIYLLFVMGDYDSSGSLYTKLLTNWNNQSRGNLPLAWSINPNLIEEYPDIISYVYETATSNDYFVSNAGSAGWYNPSRVQKNQWEAVVAHHAYYFAMADMTIAPDIWDYTALSKDSEAKIELYAPDGIGVLVSNQNGTLVNSVKETQHLTVLGTPVDVICNSFPSNSPTITSDIIQKLFDQIMNRKRQDHAIFMSTRVVWTSPEYVENVVNEMQKAHPEYNIHVVDPYTYYDLLRLSLK